MFWFVVCGAVVWWLFFSFLFKKIFPPPPPFPPQMYFWAVCTPAYVSSLVPAEDLKADESCVLFLPWIADRGRRWLLERSALTRSLSVSPSLADSTYLSLSLLLLGDPFLGNVLAGAGAASSLCIPPAKQAPKATCRPSSAFLCLAPRTPPLASALDRQTARWAWFAHFFLFIYFFKSSCGKLFFFFFLSEGWGKKSLHYYLHYLEVHFVFWPPGGGLFLQESGCWKRHRPLPHCPLLLSRSSRALCCGLLALPWPRGFVCVCVLCVCASVCVVWVGSCRAAAGTERIPGPGWGWGLSDQQRRLLPAPGLDGFAAGAPSNSAAAQEPPEVTRGVAEGRGARSPRARPLPSRGSAPATGIYTLLKLLGFLRRVIHRGGTVWRRDLFLQSLDLRRRWKFSPSSWSCPSVGLEPGKRRLQIQSFISVRGCCVCWCCWTLFQFSFATFPLLAGFPPPAAPALF